MVHRFNALTNNNSLETSARVDGRRRKVEPDVRRLRASADLITSRRASGWSGTVISSDSTGHGAAPDSPRTQRRPVPPNLPNCVICSLAPARMARRRLSAAPCRWRIRRQFKALRCHCRRHGSYRVKREVVTGQSDTMAARLTRNGFCASELTYGACMPRTFTIAIETATRAILPGCRGSRRDCPSRSIARIPAQ